MVTYRLYYDLTLHVHVQHVQCMYTFVYEHINFASLKCGMNHNANDTTFHKCIFYPSETKKKAIMGTVRPSTMSKSHKNQIISLI